MEFDFEVQHRLKQKHMAADILSRLLTSQKGESNNDDDISGYDVGDVHAVTDFKL